MTAPRSARPEPRNHLAGQTRAAADLADVLVRARGGPMARPAALRALAVELRELAEEAEAVADDEEAGRQ